MKFRVEDGDVEAVKCPTCSKPAWKYTPEEKTAEYGTDFWDMNAIFQATQTLTGCGYCGNLHDIMGKIKSALDKSTIKSLLHACYLAASDEKEKIEIMAKILGSKDE